MNDANLRNINKRSGYNAGETPAGKIQTGQQQKTTGTQKAKGVNAADDIESSLNADAIVHTSTKQGSSSYSISSAAFKQLGINDTIPEPVTSANQAGELGDNLTTEETDSTGDIDGILDGDVDGIDTDSTDTGTTPVIPTVDISNPSMEGLMSLLNTLVSQLETGSAQSQIETLKGMDAQILNKIKDIQENIRKQLKKKEKAKKGFQGFLNKICGNKGLNKIARGLKIGGKYTSLIMGILTLLVVIICPLCAPMGVFLFIDGIDQMTGNKIYKWVESLMVKVLVGFGMDKHQAKKVAKIINYVVYMVGMAVCIAFSGWNPVTMGPLLMVTMTMGRSGQGFQDFNRIIDTKAQAERTIKKLKKELMKLLQQREAIAVKIQELIEAELNGQPIEEANKKELQKEIRKAVKAGTASKNEFEDIIKHEDFTSNDPDALITDASGEDQLSIMKSPEMTEILLDIMQQVGIKFTQDDKGKFSFDTSASYSTDPSSYSKPVALTDAAIDSMSRNELANLLTGFLAKVLNTPQLFQSVVLDLQKEISEAIQNRATQDELEDLKYSGETGMF